MKFERFVLLIAVTIATNLQVCAQENELVELSTERLEKIDALFTGFDTPDSPGYAVAVVKSREVLLAAGYGSANLDYGIELGDESVFNVASLSKQFTAAALSLLIIEGKISLEDPVAKHINDFPLEWSHVRIEHLIYMTSGIPEYFRLLRPGGKDWYRDYFEIDDAIKASLSQPELEFEPGTRWEYSNVNYMLVARIVENVANQPLSQFLKDRLFNELGMTDSLVNDDVTQVIPNRVVGYNYREGGGFTHHDRVSPHYGGSGVFSTVSDLIRWDRSFYTHELAGPEFTKLMLSTRKFRHDKANDAFGLVWGEYEGRKTVWYEGGDLGFSSYMIRIPEDELSVIVLSNIGSGRASEKARRILEILYSN